MNATETTTTHIIELTPARAGSVWDGEGTRGRVWETPEDVRIVGSFKHQGRNAPFGITYTAPDAVYRREYMGPVEASGQHEAWLSARASVISAHREAPQKRINVATGDHVVLFVADHGEIGKFVITDDRPLHNPRLELI